MKKCFQNIAIKLGIKRPPLPPQREIPIGPISKKYFVTDGYSLKKLYGDNEIKTSRYTWYGFIFQNLGEQAQRIANFYFIVVAVIQLFTDSPVTPAISILPLVFVLGLTMVKQGYEDWLRHKADREINHVKVEIVTEEGRLQTVKAQDLTVGNIVLCRANDTFPCDLLLLSSSESNGECFVTTASLDGETNLKRFVASEHTKVFDSPDLIATELRGTIKCQQPVVDLYNFSGRVVLEKNESESLTFPIGPENLLLRGACLRNTDFVYACAVYTGQDTKMTLNSKGKKTKFSQVERKLNLCLLMILLMLLVCCLISSILYYTTTPKNAWYIPPQSVNTWNVVQTFFGFIVLYNYVIPISLYVTIEIQRFIGSLFFEWDLNLYDSNIDEKAKANTSDLIEEMGQVEYLFTDKTGTLTENCMRFRQFATPAGTYCVKGKTIYTVLESPNRRRSSCLDPEPQLGEIVNFGPSSSSSSSSFQPDSPSTSSTTSETSNTVTSINTLLMVLALCHTVRVERSLPGQEIPKPSKRTHRMLDALVTKYRDPPKRGSSALRRASAAQAASAAVRASVRGQKYKLADYTYQASSPDEKAFVDASRDLGVVYHGEDQSGIQVVTLHGLAIRYRRLDVLEFDATRKCMTVVLQPLRMGSLDSDDAPIIVLCKGAETSMFERMRSPNAIQFQVPDSYRDPICLGLTRTSDFPIGMTKQQTMERVTEFATSGLRTLVMGAKLITNVEWRHLKSELDEARGTLENRDQALARVYSKIEQGFTLIGCTGIEDMLQDGVAETIVALREAGIQVWVLTGDKEETAVNISYSAGHFYPEMIEIRVTKQDNLFKCLQEIEHQLERMKQTKSFNNTVNFGFVIDGPSLNFALEVPLREKFIECCLHASTVLCCRLTPLQKAEVVRLIKESRNPPPVTAAIGDGANDVSMILEAHVGFGLFGKEGRQAVRAADYAFGRFRFLKTAILFHGYTYYVRMALIVLYFFYKNVIFSLPQMLFQFFCAYSAQSIHPEIYLVFFNLTMTFLPIFLFGLFEIPIQREILLSYPSLYKSIVRNRGMSTANFMMWVLLSLWHAFVIFFGAYFLAFRGQAGGGSNAVTGYGGSSISEIVCFGNFEIMGIFLVTNIRMFFFTYVINWVVGVAFVVGILLNLAMFLFMNYVLLPFETAAQLFGTYETLWGGSGLGTGWFGLIVIIFLAIAPDFALRTMTDQGWIWRLEELKQQQAADEGDMSGGMKSQTQPKHVESTQSARNVNKYPKKDEKNSYSNPSFDWINGDPANQCSRSEMPSKNNRLQIEDMFEQGPMEGQVNRTQRLLDYAQLPPVHPARASVTSSEKPVTNKIPVQFTQRQSETNVSRM